MSFESLNNRLLYLLEGQVLERIRQDHPAQVTIQFKQGPRMYIALPKESAKLDISMVETEFTSQEWNDLADDTEGPSPPGRE